MMDDEIKRLEELVKQGDVDAMNKLGYYYLYGQNRLLQDYEKAKELFEEAVNLGNASAMNILGYMYEHGEGVSQDYSKAKELYEKAANLGNTSAMNKLGYMYEHGEGVSQDYKKAKELYEKAANLENAKEMNKLGYMYEHGEGVSQDYSKAKELYEKAANLGNSSAMNNLGYMYELGQGVSQDYEKAKELFEKAANLGNSSAMNNLGYMYELGQGVSQDYEKAKELFEKAANLGNTDAMNNLGYMYEYGKGVPQDYKKAKELYEEEYKSGMEDAKESLDRIKQKIKETQKNNNDEINYKDKTIEELEELVKKDDDKAMYELGIRYCNGKGVEKDIEKSLELFEHAISLGNTSSMVKLGTMYFLGKDVSQDYKKSIQLFNDAKIVYEKEYKQNKDKNKDKYYLGNIEYIEAMINEVYKVSKVVDSSEPSDKKDKEVLPNDVVSKPKVNEEVERLKRLVSNLSSKYVSREQTVRMLANNIYHGRRVIKEIKDNKMVRDNISTILLISSTGGGKTAIISDLAKEFNVPFTSVSLSAGYTQAGYKGLDLHDIFKKLINVADGDVEKAQEGIIILDEFDKIRVKEDAHDEEFKRALQQELLSYLEGREVQLDTKGGPTAFNTSKLTFILAGAFQDITEYDMNYSDEEIKEAISKGYESELLGRIGIYHYMPKYTKEDYMTILNNSKISPLSNFIVSCSIHGKNVITSPYSPFIESVAEEAVKLDKGVRGLNSIFANILNWYLDDLIYGEDDISLMEPYETIKKKKGRGK